LIKMMAHYLKLKLHEAFQRLFLSGAENVTVGGCHIWLTALQQEMPFSGADDALLVATGDAEAFHVVLSGVVGSEQPIPDLGVFVFTDGLTLDYRMGPAWGQPQIESLLVLLRQLRKLGGAISVPWWGSDGERSFLEALSGA
jgi:hypothetical protein